MNSESVNKSVTSSGSSGKAIQDNKELLLVALAKFYKNNSHLYDVIQPIIEGKSDVSLRLIDYYMTNYSKSKNVVLVNKNADGASHHFPVHQNYRQQLKAYSKLLFDVFRRRDRIIFHFDSTRSIFTTIGQLCCFRWLVENGVLDDIILNKTNIEKEMITSQKEHSKNPEKVIKYKQTADGSIVQSTRKKRTEISKSHGHSVSRFIGNTTISFD